MTEYISRVAALDAFCEVSIPTFNMTGEPILDVDYVKALKMVPNARVVDVVKVAEKLLADGYCTDTDCDDYNHDCVACIAEYLGDVSDD